MSPKSGNTFIVLWKFRFDQGNDQAGDVAITTTDAPLTLNSPWTYNTLNTVCFTQAWTANENAEMGIVQTRVADKQMGYQDRVVGFTPAVGTLVRSPIFVVQNYTAQQLPRITVDGNPIAVNTGADAGAFVSLNAATNELWATLDATIDTGINVQIMA